MEKDGILDATSDESSDSNTHPFKGLKVMRSSQCLIIKRLLPNPLSLSLSPCSRTGIPSDHAMRLKQICSTLEPFDRRGKELTEFLVARGYHRNMVPV